MAIYRESPSSRRLMPIVAALGIGLVLIVAVVMVVLGSVNNSARSSPPTVDNGLPAAEALYKISASLDLFQIEFDKITAGTAANQTGAPGAITTAINSLNAAPSLSKLNRIAYADLETDLNTLNAALHTSPAPDIKNIMIDTQKQMHSLSAASVTNTPATAVGSH